MNRGRGRGRGGRGGFRGQRLRGLFADGIWQCDCNPRLPAEHFKVKKEGKNHGRWFYTCQKPEPQRCAFFLWDDEAKVREEGAVLNNSRNETRPPTDGTSNRHDAGSNPSPATVTVQSVPLLYPKQELSGNSPRSNRIQQSANDEFGEETDDWATDLNTMRRLEADAMAQHQQPLQPQEPKTPVKRNYASMNEHGLPTPQTDSRSHLSHGNTESASGKRRATESDFLNLVSPATTPSPLRFQDIGDEGSGTDDPLFKDIQQTLATHGVNLSPEITSSVKDVCNRSTLRTRGVVKGREISRLALKARDAKIVELQRRIETLEAELETERAIVRHLRWENEVGQE